MTNEKPYMPYGWSAKAWREELLRKATACEHVNPHIAERYRRMAEAIEIKADEPDKA